MKLLNFKTIRIRLTTWFLILALTPLSIGILIIYNQEKQLLEQENIHKLTAIRNLKVQQLENWLNESMGNLRVMAGDYEIRGLENIFERINKSSDDLEKIEIARNLLIRNLQNFDRYEEIFIIGANTKLVELSSNSSFMGADKSNNLYFTVPLETGEIYIKDIYYSKTLNRPQMTVSVPIHSLAHSRHILGILVVRINLDNSLYPLLQNKVGLGETGETLIVNKDVIALNELRGYNDAVLKLKINAEPAFEAAAGNTGIVKTLDYQDNKVLAAYTYIPQTGWGFISKQDLLELNAPINAMVIDLFVLFIVSALVIIIIVFWLSKKISNPIVNLNIAANKIRGGDYSVRTVVDSKDELSSLANSVNEMTATIESRIKIQKGVADISETMIAKTTMQEFGSGLLKQLMELTEANMCAFYILNEAEEEFEHYVSIGANEELLNSFDVKNPQGEVGNAIARKSIYYLRDIPENTIFKYKTIAGDAIPKEIISIPILLGNTVVALISLAKIQKFTAEALESIMQSWIAINTSYSTLMSNERTRILAEHLSNSNQQLEVQSEELQVQSEELQEQTEELQRSSEELQEQNIELEAQRNEVEEASKLKSEFLSNMSHELRTPLNSIMALSRVLIMQSKEKLDEDENNYLEIIERNGKRLLSLINDILDLSKVEAGKMEVFPEFISISALLQLISENMFSLVEEKGLSLKLDIPENLPKVETDESRLHQVLLNIVSNAVKFTKQGSIDISVRYNSKSVFIDVKDGGIGISEEVLPTIFDEFKQADGTASRQYEGTGLGLAIANKLTAILGGNITVDSILGEGSTFTISIPISWHEEGFREKPMEFHKSSSLKNEKDKSEQLQRKDFSGTRILIVEDNTEAIIQVKSVLENENYTVDVAGGGQEALDYIKHTIPDGIILDLMMPGIGGFEVLEKLRSTRETKNIPVLILTAKDLTKEDLLRLSSNNMQQLIHKGDIDMDGLLFKVKLMLGNDPEIDNKVIPIAEKESKSNIHKKKGKMNSEIPQVLVIEDNPDNMTTIKAILKEDFSIWEAFDGEKALKMIDEKLPDIILLDMSLPKMNGEAIVKILKGDARTRDIPVIAVTSQAMKGDRDKFINAGCDGYIAKPIDPFKLPKEMKRLLNSLN